MAALKQAGLSQREIARRLGRSPSTISRKIRRNATKHDGSYRAEKAHSYAVAKRKRVWRKSWYSPAQWQQVVAQSKLRWSPEQVSATWRAGGICAVSHETIYRYILKDKKAQAVCRE